MTDADIGVIGGSGLYAFLEDATEVEVATPYGAPSDPLVLGAVSGRRVAFVPRHGRDHRFPPHRIPYRANMWALRSLGVRQILAPCAVGSLRPTLPAGSLVVPDQLVDRTSGRAQTFHDSGAVHVSFAEPYCPVGRLAAAARARAGAWEVTDRGTMVVVEGPRFSTRAESQWFAAQGWDIVNMTGHPEAVLARELGVCYATIALVTDVDAGISAEESVDQAQVFALFEQHIGRLKELLREVVTRLPDEPPSCSCADWLDDVTMPFEIPGPAGGDA